jgi:hypothetical protein
MSRGSHSTESDRHGQTGMCRLRNQCGAQTMGMRKLGTEVVSRAETKIGRCC